MQHYFSSHIHGCDGNRVTAHIMWIPHSAAATKFVDLKDEDVMVNYLINVHIVNQSHINRIGNIVLKEK